MMKTTEYEASTEGYVPQFVKNRDGRWELMYKSFRIVRGAMLVCPLESKKFKRENGK